MILCQYLSFPKGVDIIQDLNISHYHLWLLVFLFVIAGFFV